MDSPLDKLTKFSREIEAAGGKVIRIKNKNEAPSDSTTGQTSWKPRVPVRQVGGRLDSSKEVKPEHEIYVPRRLKTGDEVIAERKALNHRAGFNFDELSRALVTVSS